MKINKPFVLSDSSVNSYGFRLLTSGYQKEVFTKNPIGYFMHERDKGVLVRWEDIKIEGDKVIGFPNINEAHPRASQTIDEINNGFLNAASVGHIIILEQSDSADLKLPGQTGVTVTKWYNRECSLVDVPGNYNAYSVYDKKGIPVNLSALSHKALQGIKGISKNLYTLSATYEPLKNANVDELLKAAIANKDITPEMAVDLKKAYQKKAEELISVLHEFGEMRIEFLMQLPWEELDKSDMLEELKRKYLFGYEWKYFLQFGNKRKTNKKAIDMDALIEWAVNNGPIDAGNEELMKKMCNNDYELLKKRVEGYIKNRYDNYSWDSWDDLDERGELENLKTNYFQLFKQKYKERFGIEYKESKK